MNRAVQGLLYRVALCVLGFLALSEMVSAQRPWDCSRLRNRYQCEQELLMKAAHRPTAEQNLNKLSQELDNKLKDSRFGGLLATLLRDSRATKRTSLDFDDLPATAMDITEDYGRLPEKLNKRWQLKRSSMQIRAKRASSMR